MRTFSHGGYQIERITKKPTLNFGYPVFDDANEMIAVVFVSLDLKWLDRLTTQFTLPTNSALTIIDDHGIVLVRYPGPKAWVGQPLPNSARMKEIIRNQSGVGEGTGVDGIRRLYAFAPLESVNKKPQAYLIIGIPQKYASSHINSLLMRNLIGLWVFGLFTLVTGWVGVNWIVLKRVDALVMATKGLSAGDLSARTGLLKDTDELGELALSFDQMANSLESAQNELLKSESEKKRFYSQVIQAVTHGKFHLADREDIPTKGDLVFESTLTDPNEYPRMRREIKRIVLEAGMDPEDAEDWILAVGEATTNAIKHAVGGYCRFYMTADRIIARVEDQGEGFQTEYLPASILQSGFSTKISMGMGYTLMLELLDEVWLSTGTWGTILQLEKWLNPRSHLEPALSASMERLG